MRGGVDAVVAPEEYLKIFLKMDDAEITAIKIGIGGLFDLDIVDEEDDVGMDPNGNASGQQSKKKEDSRPDSK